MPRHRDRSCNLREIVKVDDLFSLKNASHARPTLSWDDRHSSVAAELEIVVSEDEEDSTPVHLSIGVMQVPTCVVADLSICSQPDIPSPSSSGRKKKRYPKSWPFGRLVKWSSTVTSWVYSGEELGISRPSLGCQNKSSLRN